MALIGSPDFNRPVRLDSGLLFHAFGSGPFQLVPTRCEVATSASGQLEFSLDLMRALSDADSHAVLACAFSAAYADGQALEAARAITPSASVTSCPLTDWWFRLVPSPALEGHEDLLAPLRLSSNGLGSTRLMARLSIESGLIFESLLQGKGQLEAMAEAQLAGVSPRLPVVVRLHSSELLPELLALADSQGALPRRLLLDYFGQDLTTLPLTVSGDVGGEVVSRFAEALTDRVVARFGRYVQAQRIEDGPVVVLTQPEGSAAVTWALGQPFLAGRRVALTIDLLSAAQGLIDRQGADAIVHRRDFTALPPLGQTRVTVLCNLPSSRSGVEALGATVTFPARPPYRPQPRSETVLFDGSDVSSLDVRLSPGEPLEYLYSAFAVLSDERGTRQLDGPESRADGSVLRLSPEDFPVEFASVEVTTALAQLAVVVGTCSYASEGQTHVRSFRLDSGQLSIGLAVPRDRESFTLDLVAVSRTGGGELRLGPFETSHVRADVTSFASYGPRQVEVQCDFDDSATVRAVSLLPAGSTDGPGNVTTVAFTPGEPRRTYRYFSASPFAPGFRYRIHDATGGAWTDVDAGVGTLVLKSTGLRSRETARETATVATEAAVEPVGTSPSADPTDELIYTRADDPARTLFVPRYALDVQQVSGQQRYRIAMVQRNAVPALDVSLVATPAPALAEQARTAAEYPHTLGIHLDFLVAASAGARKTLPFTDITRNGPIVTATLFFASLAERDDVYRAMTEESRQARLVITRSIDVSVPQRPPTPSVPAPGLVGDTGPSQLLPRRPIQDVPRTLLTKPLKPVVDLVPALTLAGTAMTMRARVERSPTGVRESGLISAVHLARPIAATLTRVPIDRFVQTLPVPQLVLVGRTDEPGFMRFMLSVSNWAEFSDEFFTSSPDLPPCGLNTAASRTWVDIQDAETGARLYGFCALVSAKQLTELWFSVPTAVKAPMSVRIMLSDRRARVEQTSNAVSTTVVQPDVPSYRAVRQALVQAVPPEPFAFPPALHAYIFQGVTLSTGSNQLVRYRYSWRGTFHTYLQDASRPSVVYVFADTFKIARRTDTPFTPFATVRVSSRPDGTAADVVFDYVVAPHIDPGRMEAAQVQLLSEPQFGATRVEFQPFVTSDVRFFVDRPTESGSVKEERAGAGVVLQGALKDTLTMPLADFRLLFDAMHRRTASLFVGRVEIGVPNDATEVVPFSARMDDLAGEMFSYAQVVEPDGGVVVTLTNETESPLDVQTLDATITRGDQRVRGLLQGTVVPHEQLRPGEGLQVRLTPESPLPVNARLGVSFDLGGVFATPVPEVIWNTILDRTTLAYFKLVTVKAIANLFLPVAGREEEQILTILVEFEGGGTAELTAATLQADVRVDYPIDDVILGRPVASSYRYTVTVVRANGRQDRDAQPREQSSTLFFVNVAR